MDFFTIFELLQLRGVIECTKDIMSYRKKRRVGKKQSEKRRGNKQIKTGAFIESTKKHE
jgi:hypothetical protein